MTAADEPTVAGGRESESASARRPSLRRELLGLLVLYGLFGAAVLGLAAACVERPGAAVDGD